MLDSARTGEHIFRGIPVSPGVRRGKVLVLTKAQDRVPEQHLAEADVPNEVQRFEQALIQTRHQILRMQEVVSERLGAQEGAIFDAHLLVLEDPVFIEEVTRRIQNERLTAEYAFQQVADKFIRGLSAIDDEYLRERAADMRDVTSRILNNLLGNQEDASVFRLTEPCIIISHDLTPSQTAQLDKRFVLGFATDVGSKTSHTAIMARSLRIPAVVGLESASKVMITGQYALLDGFNGLVIINPTDQTLFEYGQLAKRQVTLEE
ncbi:MAG TPA: phosphoenolpyruvate-utilizing N-terminal domain-containing protein, partial [Verrucomicrobiae bacterium]|nr:phosphoenolpyruvate-utilizing N-terminal domain-containing protein [Verrucomicrobiae bacterium]